MYQARFKKKKSLSEAMFWRVSSAVIIIFKPVLSFYFLGDAGLGILVDV